MITGLGLIIFRVDLIRPNCGFELNGKKEEFGIVTHALSYVF